MVSVAVGFLSIITFLLLYSAIVFFRFCKRCLFFVAKLLAPHASAQVIQHLRHIADAGVPVICSLLQPSQDIFDLFDTILVLNEREMTYFGPMSEVLDYYEETAGYRCPHGKNVAEFLRTVAAGWGCPRAD